MLAWKKLQLYKYIHLLQIHVHTVFQQYEEFVEQLLETMKVDSIAVDLGFDMRLKLVLSRVEQLVKQQATALVESKSLSYSLQQKVCYTNS